MTTQGSYTVSQTVYHLVVIYKYPPSYPIPLNPHLLPVANPFHSLFIPINSTQNYLLILKRSTGPPFPWSYTFVDLRTSYTTKDRYSFSRPVDLTGHSTPLDRPRPFHERRVVRPRVTLRRLTLHRTSVVPFRYYILRVTSSLSRLT